MIGETVLHARFSGRYVTNAHRQQIPVLDDGVPVDHVAYAPKTSVEVNGQQVVNTATLYRDGELATSPFDQWTVRGQRFQQDGEGQIWRSPFTGRTRTAVTIERITG